MIAHTAGIFRPRQLSVAAALVMLAGTRAASASAAAADEAPSLTSRMKGAFLGPLVADALALATHYEYDATKIKQFYGQIDRYYSPGEKTGGETHGVGWGQRNFHGGNGNGPPKGAGEQTDYGDYNILLLQHLAAEASGGSPVHRLDLAELLPRWQAAMQTWRSWMCTQTRQTLQQVDQGYPHGQLGGGSNAMSLRTAAAYGYFAEEEDVVHFAHTAMFTHREQTAHEGAEFFSRVAFRVMHRGLAPRAAIEEVAALPSSSAFVKTKVAQGLAKADEATDASSALSGEEFVDNLAITSMARLWDVGKTEPIKVGKASPTEGTLPGSIYFIVKYAGDFAGAAIANTMVGGDNAARAVAIGMVMGAAQGVEGIPASLGKGHLVEWEASEALLDQLPLIKAAAAGKGHLVVWEASEAL